MTAPDFRNASCVDHADLYDVDRRAEDLGLGTEAGRWMLVKSICRRCPARASCWQWAEGLASRQIPAGPTARTQQNPFTARARREAADLPPSPAAKVPAGPCRGYGLDGGRCPRPTYMGGLCLAHYRRRQRDPNRPASVLLAPIGPRRGGRTASTTTTTDQGDLTDAQAS